MTEPAYNRAGVTIHCGDCREVLKSLPDESVNCCVTSPPYWGLRDYGTATWDGGDSACDHLQPESWKGYSADYESKQKTNPGNFGYRQWHTCGKCGAIRMDRQIGLEKTPAEFVETMVAVFREVRRVLRDDGTLWLNLGDTYNNAGSSNNGKGLDGKSRGGATGADGELGYKKRDLRHALKDVGIKHKDLIGIPWRVALALQADGWYLRQDIIWHKPNPMPESVRDRCTKAHEYIFLLSKSTKYHYDADAIAEPCMSDNQPSNTTHKYTQAYIDGDESHRTKAGLVAYAEKRRSWNGSEFQTGKTGVHQCNRAQKVRAHGKHSKTDEQASGRRMTDDLAAARAGGASHESPFGETRNKRSVWSVSPKAYKKAHFAVFPPELITPCILAGCPPGGTVLDPFGGSGTTAQVAKANGRKAAIIELNPDYLEMIKARVRQDSLPLTG